MDKKHLTFGILFGIAAFSALILGSRTAPPAHPAPEVGGTPLTPAPGTPNQAPAPGGPVVTTPSDATFAALASDNADAVHTSLANDFIDLRLTNYGGAIDTIALLKYPAALKTDDPYIFNAIHADPILAFSEQSFPGLGRSTRYELVRADATEVVYRAILENRIEITRRFALPAAGEDPYRIRHETTFRNLAETSAPAASAAFSLGTTALVSSNDNGLYLNVASYDGDKADVTDRKDLEGGGFLSAIGLKNNPPKTFIEKNTTVEWAAVKNQFFASIYTPDTAGTGVVVRRAELPSLPGVNRPNIGVTGSARFNVPALAPGASATLSGLLYVGPKEYTRLSKFDRSEDKIMQFDRYFFNRIFFSGYIAPFMNWLMNKMHGLVRDWGLAIVFMTILLKIVTLPFTLAASKSAKRMQKLQPLMQALREKHKDNPQKMNQATMELFKEHRVNPAGGCIPVLITIPLFVAFFAMLQGTAELRFQSFLWAQDLSAPDTIVRLFGLPLNIMPLLMGATMVFQMRLTPSPSADNAQAAIFKFMPVIFTLICYNFSCALALYSTVNGLFTIGQQIAVNKLTKDEAPLQPAPARGGKPVKNVTPKKKK